MSYRTYTVHELTKDGKLQILKQVLDQTPELRDALDSKGLHCLHIAAYTGDLLTTNELLRRGANKDLQRPDGMSPILIAAMRGNVSLVMALALEHRANVNIIGPMGYTVLHFLSMKGLTDAVRTLLTPGNGISVNLNARNGELSTPLHAAVGANHLDVALLLISHGADKGAVNKAGKTPLMCLGGKHGEANRRLVLEALEKKK